MGGPCDQLIPVAILYENPQGLTLGEFQRELTKIVPKKRNLFMIDSSVKSGKYGLTRILNLNETRKYRELKRSFFDSDFKYNKEIFFNFYGSLAVRQTSHKLIDEGIKFNITVDNPFKNEGRKLGDYLDNTWLDIPEKYQNKGLEFQITEILNTKLDDCKNPELNLEGFWIEQEVIARAVDFKIKKEKFNSIASLKKKYPYYSPEEIYDFSSEEGQLYPSCKDEKHASFGRVQDVFKWTKKGGKYFLDINYMLDRLSPNSVYVHDARTHDTGCAQSEATNWRHETKHKGYSLTDLVLTCEAVRKGDQKILNHDGFRYGFFDFIYKNRETLAKYEKAILDNETSQIAIKNQQNHFDFLREHMFMMTNLNLVSYENKVKFSKLQKEQFGEERRKWIKEHKHLFKRKEKGVPF